MAYVPFRLDEILRAHMSGQDVLSALIYIYLHGYQTTDPPTKYQNAINCSLKFSLSRSNVHIFNT